MLTVPENQKNALMKRKKLFMIKLRIFSFIFKRIVNPIKARLTTIHGVVGREMADKSRFSGARKIYLLKPLQIRLRHHLLLAKKALLP